MASAARSDDERVHDSLCLGQFAMSCHFFFIKQVIKIHCDYNMQLHQPTKINLIKTQFLKE